ncbi:MAG: transporter ATP-binding protein [Symbiobacteriaceae bacterium]|jgi:ABC-2 type transport system ATP-binding protein|nr:transporter ATP-binding protein [Symbiobacteriaceae bacterium]
MLKVDGLQKVFGTFPAVSEMNFALEPGAIYGFVGPNGAGKTTTMKMIATLLKPTAGCVYIGDCEVTRDPAAARRHMGYMPDFFGVYDDLKVTEYMDFYADCYKVPRAGRDRLIGDLLELVNLSHKKDAYVDSLSRGMKQRLCLARCLVHDPNLLILDEPASGLDPRARVEMRELLHELHRMGKTILISSHILSELSEMCTHIGIVDQGRLVVSGPVQQVLRRAGARLMEIRVAGDPETAAAAARSVPYVTDAQVENGLCRATVDGDEQAVASLLAALVQSGVPVIHFAEAQSKLEDVFMSITGGGHE